MQVRSTWRGPQYTRMLTAHVRRNLASAADANVGWIRDSISIQGSYVPPVHSPPYAPPYRISGDLWRSYRKVMAPGRELSVRWGSSLPYALWLEFGWDLFAVPFAPRPHVRRALYANIPATVNIVRRPMP